MKAFGMVWNCQRRLSITPASPKYSRERIEQLLRDHVACYELEQGVIRLLEDKGREVIAEVEVLEHYEKWGIT